MNIAQALLLSLVESGRWAVLIAFSLLGAGVVVHVFKGELGSSAPASRDPRSWAGALATVALGVAVPVCVHFGWGSARPWLPMPVAATLAGVGTLSCFIALNYTVWAALTLGRAAHILARVDRGAKLVRQPPFDRVRHPIYLGMGLLFAGAALAALSWAAAIVALLWWPLALHRARLEDAVLKKAYGAEFEAYARSTPAVWPRF
jgi:protein-S-isoprenylcysteine O-methyltransferase Ste14